MGLKDPNLQANTAQRDGCSSKDIGGLSFGKSVCLQWGGLRGASP